MLHHYETQIVVNDNNKDVGKADHDETKLMSVFIHCSVKFRIYKTANRTTNSDRDGENHNGIEHMVAVEVVAAVSIEVGHFERQRFLVNFLVDIFAISDPPDNEIGTEVDREECIKQAIHICIGRHRHLSVQNDYSPLAPPILVQVEQNKEDSLVAIVTTVPKQHSSQILELNNRIVSKRGSLVAFFSLNTDSDMGGLYHVHVIEAVANA